MTGSADRRRVSRRARTVVLLIGSAAAVFVTVQVGDSYRHSGDDRRFSGSVEPLLPASDDSAESPTPAPRDVAADDVAQNPAEGTFTVAVSPLHQQAGDPDTIRATEEVYAALLDELRRIPGLELIELAEGVEPDMSVCLYRFDITGTGSGGSWRILIEAMSAELRGTSMSFGGSGTLALSLVLDEVIANMRDNLFPADESLIADLEARLLDRSLTESQRLSELRRLQSISFGVGDPRLSDVTINAAIELGTASEDPVVREQVWRFLGNQHDRRLLQPLSDALLYDPDEDVRMAVVLALAGLDDSLARSALASAGLNDASPEVRQNARWASLDDAGRRELLLISLLNTRLGVDERLAPLELRYFSQISGPGITGVASIMDASVAAALTELFPDVEEPERRIDLVRRLEAFNTRELRPVIVARMLEDPDIEVRYTAVLALRRFVDDPVVRQALERAASGDASDIVRSEARSTLDFPPARP